jgi:1,4-alpha-glucan branching enzyme
MSMRWTSSKRVAIFSSIVLNSQKFGIKYAVLMLCVGLINPAGAQSARPGWGSMPYHDSSGTGVTFRVWAPNATSVYVPGEFNGWSTTTTPLAKEITNSVWDGVWSADVANLTPGKQYKYYVNYSGGSVWKHDPRARCVSGTGTASGANDLIYDPTAFNWQGDTLSPRALNNLVIYEIHAGTLNSSAGVSKFVAATNRLDYLKALGVNAVEVMPPAEFPGGSSWGYNPAQIFAVESNAYGGPDAFKTFVQACHLRGIAVLVDVVHNHYGPTDLDIWNFDGWTGTNSLGGGGIYFYQSNTNLQKTPWGNTRPNFNSQQVANFVQDNFTLWLSEYHVDGFRWDTPNTMMYAYDGTYIPAAGNLIIGINAMIHTNYPGKLSISEDVHNSYGFDSAWDTSYPYAWRPVLTNVLDANRDMAAVSNAIVRNVRYGGQSGPGRVAFLESHDVVGDLNGGVRLVSGIDPALPASYRARKLSTLGAAVTFLSPGVPMLFQGQEMLEDQPFNSSLLVDWTKTNTYSRIVQFYRDLIGARRNLKGYTAGLEGNQCSVLQMDNVNKLVAFHRWKSAYPIQDAVVVANFTSNLRSSYAVNFPFAGTWYAHLNSDSTIYSSDYSNSGSSVVTASGSPVRANVTIGPYSALVFSPTPDAPPQLSISSSNGLVRVAYPSFYSAWELDQTTSITGNSAWAQVPSGALQTNATTISLTVSPGGTAYYRLVFRPD